MSASAYRKCGSCEQPLIPRWVDWPWWADGRPLCIGCQGNRRESANREDAASDVPSVSSVVLSGQENQQ